VGLAKKAIIFISTVFLGMLLYNTYLDSQLTSLKDEQDNLYALVSQYEDDYDIAMEADAKILMYKETLALRVPLVEKVEAISKRAVSGVQTLKFEVSQSGYKVHIEGGTPLNVASYISDLFSTNAVSEVTLKSVNYRKSTDVFAVEMEGSFKNE
jgi:hypothetical protein